jgi:thioredoxin:protein disulfide reductase
MKRQCMSSKRRIVLAGLLLAAGAGFSQAKIDVRLSAEPDRLPAGGTGRLVVEISMPEGTHITAPPEGLFGVVPDSAQGLRFLDPKYPDGVPDKYGKVYKGAFRVIVPFSAAAGAAPGERRVRAVVTVQQCGESQGVCYAPEDVAVEAVVAIGPAAAGGSVQSAADADGPSGSEAGGPAKRDLAGRVAEALERGSLAAFLLVFFGGLLTSFTPCVYPMIPITMAVIGARSSGKKLGGFVLSLFYVLGIAVTFSALGVIAAKTGSLFGTFMNHPVVTVLIALIFLGMGLSMLGAFVMQMPPALASKLRGKKRGGFLGIFLTGLVSGLIVSPCISPLLVVILAWVAKKGSLLLGAGLLFSFALGLGVLFVVIGTFSGALKALPKSGRWMEIIERGFGILLVTLALVFVRPVIGHFLYVCAWSAYLIVFGTFLGAFSALDKEARGADKIRKAAAVFLVLLGGILLWSAVQARAAGVSPGSVAARESSVSWITSEEEAFTEAKSTGVPLLIDFAADWCAACRELDGKTWPDPAVIDAVGRFVPLRLDMTKTTEAVRAAQKKYGIVGMPTVLVVDPSGKELGRFTGFKGPEETAEFLEAHGR